MTDARDIMGQCPCYQLSARYTRQQMQHLDPSYPVLYEYDCRMLQLELEQAQTFLDRVSVAVDKLDALEQGVIRARYLSSDTARCVPWKEVCIRLYGSDTSAHQQAMYRLHRQAIEKLNTEFERAGFP